MTQCSSVYFAAKNDLENAINRAIEQEPPGGPKRIIRVEIALNKCDALLWLAAQKNAAKTYWRDRESRFEMAGVGESDVVCGSLTADNKAIFSRLNEYLKHSSPGIRYYGGMRFSRSHSSGFHWQPFTSFRFIVPLFEVFREGSETVLAANIPLMNSEPREQTQERVLEQLHQLVFEAPPQIKRLPDLNERKDLPERNVWHRKIDEALQAISQKKLDKIVLARKSLFRFEQDIPVIDLLWKLRLNNHRAYYFCFQPQHNIAFIGGTPEQLYKRGGRQIHTEAVAGTRRRGHNPEEDLQLEQDLLNSEKDVREHRYVVDSIRQALDGICSSRKQNGGLNVLKLSRLQHLRLQFKGELRTEVADPDILDSLHPTPAVGGVPTEASQQEIEKIEPFDRGWYAGPVGWVGQNMAEFAVAIRSGLIDHKDLYLYSGAGIVQGSDAEKEWEEIESKIASFLRALSPEDEETILPADTPHSVSR